MAVDGSVAVRLIQTWWSNEESAATVAGGYDKMNDGQVSDDDHYLFSGTGGVGETKSCASTNHPDQDLFAVIQVFTTDREDSDAMGKLITAYTKALEDSHECNTEPGSTA